MEVIFLKNNGGFYCLGHDSHLEELGGADVVVVGDKAYLPVTLEHCPACGSEDFIVCELCHLLAEVVLECGEKARKAYKAIRVWEAKRYR